MGRLTSALGRRLGFRDDALAWSSLALAAGVAAACLDPLPVAVPRRTVRIGAALAMTVWCWLGTFSLGPLFLPCLLLMIVAAVKKEP